MLENMDRTKKIELYLSLALAFAFICYAIAIQFIEYPTEVARDRWVDAEALINGTIPIKEYPPFALVFMLIPRLFSWDCTSYNVAWVIMTLVFTLIGLEITRRIAKQYGYSEVKSMAIYGMLMVILLPFITDHFDIFPAIMCLAAFYMVLRDKPIWAFVLLSLGTLTKVYPAFLILVLLMMYLVRKDWKSIGMGIVVSAITALAVMIPFYIMEPASVTNFLTYNSNRPLEIGSMPATLLYPFSMIGLFDVWILPWDHLPESYGSDDLMGSVPDAVAGIMMPLMVIAVLASILYYGHIRNRRNERSDEKIFLAASGMLIVIMMLILFGKVFSSQYLLWAIPFFVLVIMTSNNPVFSDRLLKLLVATFLFTEINCGYIYGYLNGGTNIDDLSMILMLARNLLVVYATYMVIREMWNVYKNGFSGEELGTNFEYDY